jgi:Protein of unknown function (DUF2505)
MTRRMDYTLAYEAPAEKIYQDFTSGEYWQSLMDVYRQHLPHSQVTSFSSGERGTDIVFSQHVPRRDLPPIARAVVPVDLTITRTQHFEPFDHEKSRAKGSYTATVTHAPGHIRGEYFLTETDTGSELRLASECKVHIPLVGGKLEELILHGLEGLFDEEQAFTADWISRHH